MIDTAAVVASADLVNRAGGRGVQIGWTCPHVPDEEDGHNCPDVTWYAHAQWKGSRLTVEGHPEPGAAATALAVRVLEGGRCRCGERVSLAPGTPGCLWRSTGDRWEPGCDVPGIEIDGGDRGDLPAMGRALNREQRRRARRKQS